jgi:ribonuclease HI
MIIYTDGSSQGNPGPSGWAYVMMPNLQSESMVICAAGMPNSTSNRMELTAILQALIYAEILKCTDRIQVYTDSQYVSRSINEGWLDKWIDNNFKNIKNKDLWLQIYKYLCRLNVQISWIKGHSENIYNDLADKLAKEACVFQGIPQVYPIPTAQLMINRSNSRTNDTIV